MPNLAVFGFRFNGRPSSPHPSLLISIRESLRLIPDDGEEVNFDMPEPLLPHSIPTLAGRRPCNSGKRPPNVSEGGEEMKGKRRESTGFFLFVVVSFQRLDRGHRMFGLEHLDFE